MTVHGYLRVSTSRQEISPDVQKEQILNYCKMHGLPEPKWYCDTAVSGKVPLAKREAGGIMMSAVKPGDHIIVAKLDRAFRKVADCCVVLDDLQQRQIRLHVVNLMGGAIDLSSAIGKFTAHLLAAFAELERHTIGERIGDAIRARRKIGRGGGPAPYGYKHETLYETKNGRRMSYKIAVPNPEERKLMGLFYQWREQGWSAGQIHEKCIDLKIRWRKGQIPYEMLINRIIRAETKLRMKEDGRSAHVDEIEARLKENLNADG